MSAYIGLSRLDLRSVCASRPCGAVLHDGGRLVYAIVRKAQQRLGCVSSQRCSPSNMYRSDGRVSWPVKLWYAAGQTGQSVTDFGFGTLLFIYYNQVLGLSGSYTGLGVAIALFFDALVDPAVGSWSDGFQSKKWGRRHLFMTASIVPLG